MSGPNIGYFQFPLCLLAFSGDYKNRLQHIVSYCVGEHGRRLNETPLDYADQTALYKAAKFLHVTVSCYHSTMERWETAGRFIREWEACNGKDASVRISTALLWEAHNNTGVTYREF